MIQKTRENKMKISLPGKNFKNALKTAVLVTGLAITSSQAIGQVDSTNTYHNKNQNSTYTYTHLDTLYSKMIGWISGELEGKDFSTLKFVMCANIKIVDDPKSPLIIDDGLVKIELSVSDQKKLKDNISVQKDIYYILPAGKSVFVYKK